MCQADVQQFKPCSSPACCKPCWFAGGYDARLAENREHLKELQQLARNLGLADRVAFVPSFSDRCGRQDCCPLCVERIFWMCGVSTHTGLVLLCTVTVKISHGNRFALVAIRMGIVPLCVPAAGTTPKAGSSQPSLDFRQHTL